MCATWLACLACVPCACSKTNGATSAKDEARAARLKACGFPANGTIHEPDSVQGECQKAVLAIVDRESSDAGAAFPGMFDDDGPLESPFGCATTYRSWVEARDRTGVEVRRKYLCTYDPRTGVASIELQ